MCGVSNVMDRVGRGLNYEIHYCGSFSYSTSTIFTKRIPLLNDSTITVQRLNECSFAKKIISTMTLTLIIDHY